MCRHSKEGIAFLRQGSCDDSVAPNERVHMIVYVPVHSTLFSELDYEFHESVQG